MTGEQGGINFENTQEGKNQSEILTVLQNLLPPEEAATLTEDRLLEIEEIMQEPLETYRGTNNFYLPAALFALKSVKNENQKNIILDRTGFKEGDLKSIDEVGEFVKEEREKMANILTNQNALESDEINKLISEVRNETTKNVILAKKTDRGGMFELAYNMYRSGAIDEIYEEVQNDESLIGYLVDCLSKAPSHGRYEELVEKIKEKYGEDSKELQAEKEIYQKKLDAREEGLKNFAKILVHKLIEKDLPHEEIKERVDKMFA